MGFDPAKRKLNHKSSIIIRHAEKESLYDQDAAIEEPPGLRGSGHNGSPFHGIGSGCSESESDKLPYARLALRTSATQLKSSTSLTC